MLLEENICENPNDLRLGNVFLPMPPKAQAVKRKMEKSGFAKNKIFCSLKDIIKKVKDNSQMGNICKWRIR